MIRLYHNHKPQTTLWHREEEPLNHHETPGRQIKQSNQLSLPHQDDYNTRTDTKQRTTKHRNLLSYFPASDKFCCLLLYFKYSLDQGQAGPDLDPNYLALW